MARSYRRDHIYYTAWLCVGSSTTIDSNYIRLNGHQSGWWYFGFRVILYEVVVSYVSKTTTRHASMDCRSIKEWKSKPAPRYTEIQWRPWISLLSWSNRIYDSNRASLPFNQATRPQAKETFFTLFHPTLIQVNAKDTLENPNCSRAVSYPMDRRLDARFHITSRVLLIRRRRRKFRPADRWVGAKSPFELFFMFLVHSMKIDTWTRSMGKFFCVESFLFVSVRYDSFVVGSLIELCMQCKAWKSIRRVQQPARTTTLQLQTDAHNEDPTDWPIGRNFRGNDLNYSNHTHKTQFNASQLDHRWSCWLQIAQRGPNSYTGSGCGHANWTETLFNNREEISQSRTNKTINTLCDVTR